MLKHFYTKMILVILGIVSLGFIIHLILNWLFDFDVHASPYVAEWIPNGFDLSGLLFIVLIAVSTAYFTHMKFNDLLNEKTRTLPFVFECIQLLTVLSLIIIHFVVIKFSNDWNFIFSILAVAIYLWGWVGYDYFMLKGLQISTEVGKNELYHEFKDVFLFIDLPAALSFLFVITVTSIGVLLSQNTHGFTLIEIKRFACGSATMHLLFSSIAYFRTNPNYIVGIDKN